MPDPWARFDDLLNRRSMRFPSPWRVVTTTRLEDVAAVLAEVATATDQGSWAYGYLSYEAAAGLDSALPGGWNSGEPPLAWFGLCSEPASVDPIKIDARHVLQSGAWHPDWSDDDYMSAVQSVRAHIAAGETYQCNLTDRYRREFTASPEALYARLALAQCGAHNAYIDIDEYVIASASPELFFEWAGDDIRTRPMKGTAPRGQTPADDLLRASALRSDQKEQAENLMIVDLLRSDLGQIACVGGVRVDELLKLERYPTVLQLTSQVSARLRPEVGLLEIFRAMFPSGSVTGAPKRRSMEILAGLELTPRGVYCGAIGFVGPPSAHVRARFNVAIRTSVIDRRMGTAVYGAGGGITWSSDPIRERAEVKTKTALLASESSKQRAAGAYMPECGSRANWTRTKARI
jgi:para-aminobenzoate synthetase/4-amino-4-deoxychorismate lyase